MDIKYSIFIVYGICKKFLTLIQSTLWGTKARALSPADYYTHELSLTWLHPLDYCSFCNGRAVAYSKPLTPYVSLTLSRCEHGQQPQ